MQRRPPGGKQALLEPAAPEAVAGLQVGSRNTAWSTSSISSSGSTQTPSPRSLPGFAGPSIAAVAHAAWGSGGHQLCRSDSDLEERLVRAELLLKERDQRIGSLEEKLRQVNEGSWAARGERASLQDQSDVHSDPDLEAQVDEACRKSEVLLRKISGLGIDEDPELQWCSLMAANEDCRDRLAQIEALVQRRVEQLPPGDAELRICRAVRGLCVGAQRSTTRRWALAP